MRVTVLGSCGAWPEAGRASSGFLVEHDGFKLVLDLGYGTLPRLLACCPAEDVGAVIITHAHADHCVDLHGLYRARAFPSPRPPRLPVYADADVIGRIGALDGGGENLPLAFDIHELTPGDAMRVGPFDVATRLLPHFIPNAGIRVSTGGRVLAYTGDTGPSPEVVALAEGADLFICEAQGQGDVMPPEEYMLTAREAGEHAARAGVARLMLTHFWSGLDRAVSAAEAAGAYRGEILVADEGLVVEV